MRLAWRKVHVPMLAIVSCRGKSQRSSASLRLCGESIKPTFFNRKQVLIYKTLAFDISLQRRGDATDRKETSLFSGTARFLAGNGP